MTERPGTVVFHRPARHHPAPVERGVVTIPAPPTAPDPAGSAVWQTVTPVLGSAGVLGFAVTTGELRHIVTAGVIAGVLVLCTNLSSWCTQGPGRGNAGPITPTSCPCDSGQERSPRGSRLSSSRPIR